MKMVDESQKVKPRMGSVPKDSQGLFHILRYVTYRACEMIVEVR